MKRFHLIEITDQPWYPASLRSGTTDYLQFVHTAMGPYDSIWPRLHRALQASGTKRVIDLCSGGAGPWCKTPACLADATSLTVCLTDKYPDIKALQRLSASSAGKIDFRTDSVDATNVPPDLVGFRTLFSSFHHFPPDEAIGILRNAVKSRQGLAVFEVTQRSFAAVCLMFLAPLMVLIFTPWIRPFRWSRLMWTYLIPVIPLATLFDGVVSCLRTYTPAELESLTATLGDTGYRWEIGEERSGRGPIPVLYLIGYQRKPVE